MEKKPTVEVGQIYHSQYNNAYCVITEIKTVVDRGVEFLYASIKWTDTLEDDEVAISVLTGKNKFDFEYFTLVS
jgi:hypothetical protein